MFVRLFVVPLVLILSLPVAVLADDAIPPETLAAVKKATVYVQTTGTTWKGTGSGFVVAVQKDSLLIATNHHVIGDHDKDRKDRMTPQELIRSFKTVTVNVVFDPGLKTEQSVKADIIAADPEIDLAILRVAKPKTGAPDPIELPTGLKLTETMPVYVFGFPFGQALSTSKGSPAVTIGKGSISSLRLDDTGTLAMVQIDGALNPGNSGGPVVDAKGQLIGVAVATIKSGQGIGLAVPGAELSRIMKGRVGGIHTVMAQTTPNKITVHVDVEVVDPTAAVRGVTLRYLVTGRGLQKPPLGETLAGRVGMKSVPLKISNGVASGDISLDASLTGLFVQAVPDGGAGNSGATEVFDVPLVPGGGFAGNVGGGPGTGGPGNGRDTAPPEADIVGPMPNGWKEYRPKDNTFSVWIPAQARSQRERERTTTVRGVRLKSNMVTVEMGNGLAYVAQEVILLNGQGGGNNRGEAEELIRDMIASEINGRVTQERNVKTGETPGKEYRIEAGRAVVKVRVFLAGKTLVVLQSVGNRDQIESAPVTTFLTSFKLAPGGAPAIGGPAPGNPFTPGPGTQPGLPNMIPPQRPGAGPGMPGNPFPQGPGQFPGNNVAAERKSKILGGFGDPEFVDEAVKGGYLVGAEIGLGQFFNNPVIHAIRPVYMVGGQEVGGNWHGPPQGKQLVRVSAKPGYAVGAITLKTGLGVDGLSMTFMKVANGKLDPTDSYESAWIGGPGGGGPEKLSGNGWLIVGLVGKAKNDAMTGLGVLYPEVAGAAPAPGLTPGAPQFPGKPGGFPQNPGGFAGNPQPLVPGQPIIGDVAANEPFTPVPPMNANNPTPAPGQQEINPPSGPSTSSTSTTNPAAPASGGSRLPIILGVVAGVLGLALAIVGVVIMSQGGSKKRRVTRRRSPRDDDDDYDDRRGSRSSRRR